MFCRVGYDKVWTYDKVWALAEVHLKSRHAFTCGASLPQDCTMISTKNMKQTNVLRKRKNMLLVLKLILHLKAGC